MKEEFYRIYIKEYGMEKQKITWKYIVISSIIIWCLMWLLFHFGFTGDWEEVSRLGLRDDRLFFANFSGIMSFIILILMRFTEKRDLKRRAVKTENRNENFIKLLELIKWQNNQIEDKVKLKKMMDDLMSTFNTYQQEIALENIVKFSYQCGAQSTKFKSEKEDMI